MSSPSVRWTLRLPWSTQVILRELQHLDAPGHLSDICGRAIGHMLDHADATIAGLAVQVAAGRAHRPSDRTGVCSLRLDPALRDRLIAWQAAHPEIALNWLVDSALRCWHAVAHVRAQQHMTIRGLDKRRYRRLARELVVVVDGDEVTHAA